MPQSSQDFPLRTEAFVLSTDENTDCQQLTSSSWEFPLDEGSCIVQSHMASMRASWPPFPPFRTVPKSYLSSRGPQCIASASQFAFDFHSIQRPSFPYRWYSKQLFLINLSIISMSDSLFQISVLFCNNNSQTEILKNIVNLLKTNEFITC